MKYSFICADCQTIRDVDSKLAFTPPPPPSCSCGVVMDRVYNARIDTSGCKDHDHIPERYRVPDGSRTVTKAGAEAKEAGYRRHIESRRQLLRGRANQSAFRHTHSVPGDLYYGKIRETGDKNYWADPGNVAKHSSTRVS